MVDPKQTDQLWCPRQVVAERCQLRAFVTRRKDFHAAYSGDWFEDNDRPHAFHHGINTVFDALEAALAVLERAP